ncbi:MAG: hypothetical protein QXQ30_02330 [Candidatus Pacearchaeota archaeon]
MKKALSPVIATVGLIAIAFALFIIIFLWTRGFIGEKVLKFGNPIEKLCEDVNFEVDIRGDEIRINNIGNVNIWKILLVKYEDGKKSSEFYFASGIQDEALSAGRYANLSVSDLSNAKKVEIYPVLLGTGEKSNKPLEFICEKQVKIINLQ